MFLHKQEDMGVKAFYKWLVNKYPKIVVNAVEKSEEYDGNQPNPNGIEFDNLYLDMNGIIHPCFHPDHDNVLQYLNSPVTYEEVYSNIFDYIDWIMNIARPRKLLYMAIDGVAPRAKMNQQRTRRYRNTKDREILEKEEDRLRMKYKIEGIHVLPKHETEVSDSNVIIPGTEFMSELSKQLQTYIRLRIANHPAWKCLKVILSDSNVPGEGEHKIMSFIRTQRTCPGYNPNTSHVLYGLDADLIMLALTTHEIHFSILREFDLHQDLKETAERMNNLEISTISKRKSLVKKSHEFLHIWILREYLQLDLKMSNLPEAVDFNIEQVIDDFIFICFFAGNDFLPSMPTLEVYESALDLVIYVYKNEFKNLGGHLVDMQRVDDRKGYINLERVEKFILAIGAYEDKIFKKRSEILESRLRQVVLEIERENGEEAFSTKIRSTCNQRSNNDFSYSLGSLDQDILENTKLLKEQLKSYSLEVSDIFKNRHATDMVKFGSPGWRERYYKYKFSIKTEEDVEKMRKKLVEKYTEGLCWVLIYYFWGVPSWSWYFPYHYAPFASDFEGLSSTEVIFQNGLPFKPFDQLMAVLPPMDVHTLPFPYQSLMTDEGSSIHEFYPSDFDIDTDGKRFLWQGICKLPFIDEERLLSATKKIESELSEDDAKRNVVNMDQLFVHSSDKLALQIISTFNDVGSSTTDTGLSEGINGFVRSKLESQNDHDCNGLANDVDVLCVYYDPPCFCVHIRRVLEGATIPEKVVNESDIEERQLWHDIQVYRGWKQRKWYPNVIKESTEGVSSHDAASLPKKEQIGGQSWWNTHGRGSRNYKNTNYPARIGNTNGQLWSARTNSGSRNNHVLNRWADTQSRNDSQGDRNGRW